MKQASDSEGSILTCEPFATSYEQFVESLRLRLGLDQDKDKGYVLACSGYG